MAQITIQKNITKRSQDEHHRTVGSVNVLEWMIGHYKEPPECGIVVALNGTCIANSDELSAEDFDKALNFEAGVLDHIIIQHRPHGTAVLLIGVGILSAAATILLAPKPSIPNNAGQESTSPNNQLTAATNEFRPRQAIPDIAGRIRAYPDFVQPSYYEYVDNQRVFRELFVIGRGYHTISGVESEKTPISPSNYTIYQPGEPIPSQKLVRGTNDVDGYEPTPSDDPSVRVSLDGATVYGGNMMGDFYVEAVDIKVGDRVEIDMSWQSSIGPESSIGIFTVSSISGGIDISVTPDPFWNPSIEVGNVTGFIRNLSSDESGRWFNTLGDQTTEIWIQAVMPQGIRSSESGNLTVAMVAYYQQIGESGEPIGNEMQRGISFSGRTIEAQRRTFKIENLEPARYRVRIVRNTPEQPEGARDVVQIEDIQSVRQYQPNFGNVTSIFIQRDANANAITQRQSKISVELERELPIFNPNNGTFGSLAPTRSFAQYVIYVMHTLGGIPLSQIDYESLFEIEGSLSSEELGYFDFSFDDADVSLRERVITACNVARVRVFYVGATWNFVREEPRPNRVALFSRRNIAPNSSSQTFRFQRDGDPDGVTIKWVDPSTNAEAYEYRRWNGSQVLNEQALRPIEEELAGCRNQTQAANRADWEINKLVNQRRRVTDTVIKDALYVGLGERVGWVDINDADLFDGEIMGISGSDYDTSERFTPLDGVDYYVYITDDEGNTSTTVQAFARSDTEFGFSAPGLSGAYVATGIQQLGSRYFIASQNELDAADFMVVSKGRPDEQGRVQIELAEVIDE